MGNLIAIDFDGTIVDHQYPDIGHPVPLALETMKELQEQGHKIILWTMRSGTELAEARKYLEDSGVKLFGVNENPDQSVWTSSKKAYAQIYIDDAALGCPLINIKGFARACVNWDEVKQHLKMMGALPND